VRHDALASLPRQGRAAHALHHGTRAWVETNCYADLWIALLHALELEPLACLGCTVAVDFEGDQWTFFKPSHADLYRLYGVDVQELTLWRSLEAHTVEQVQRGRVVLIEVDSFHLPDTAATDYRTRHTKTTIGIAAIDPDRGRLGYFHNAGYFELGPDDYAGVLPGRDGVVGALPPYVEFVKLDGRRRLPEAALVETSLALLAGHLARAPRVNPVATFAARFRDDLAQLRGRAPDAYHGYAFATLRQLGGALELAAHHLRWLECHGEHGLGAVAANLETVSTTAKAMLLKTARAVATDRPVDFGPMLATMQASWERGLAQLHARYGA
jgi:hypothetical protein